MDRQESITRQQSARMAMAAYEAGRLFNELGWHLDQAVILGLGRPIAEVERVLGKLAAKVLASLPIEEAIRVKGSLLKVLEDWRRATTSEELAEDLSQARHNFENNPDKNLEECFSSLLLTARAFKAEVRGAIEAEFKKNENLHLAFLLGECVDQGLRPPGVHERVYRYEPNIERWARKHSQSYRHEVARYQRQRAILLAGRSRPLRLSPEMLGRPSPPSLPEKTLIVRRTCRPGSDPPPSWWYDAVKALWERAELPSTLPTGKLSYFKGCPTPFAIRGVVKLLDRLAKEGLVRQGSASTSCGDELGSSIHPTVAIPHTLSQYSRAAGVAAEGYAVSVSGSGELAPATPTPSDAEGPEEARGGSMFDHQSETGPALSASGDEYQAIPKLDSEVPPSTEIPRVEKPLVPKDEAEYLAREYIEKNQHMPLSVRKIARATGISTGGVHKTRAWREYMEKRRQVRVEQSVQTRNLRDYSMDSFGIESDPSIQAEQREVMEKYYFESVGEAERLAYRNSSEDVKLGILLPFLE